MIKKVKVMIPKKMELNQNNYYSDEANWAYRSKSQYWNFKQCEARALAEMKGEWKPKRDNTPLIFGNYLHSFFESYKSHKSFIKEHIKDLYKYGKKEKGLKKVYQQADTCIHSLCRNEDFKYIYQGSKEVIVKGDIDGVTWMGKIDCLNLEKGLFLDLKTVDDMHKKYWIDGSRTPTNFIEARGYYLQMAIYRELIKKTFNVDCQPVIVAVSKQNVPEKKLIRLRNDKLQESLNDLIWKQEHFNKVINGESEPNYCGHCDYCRKYQYGNKLQIIYPEDIEFD